MKHIINEKEFKGFKGTVSIAGSFGQDERKQFDMIASIESLPHYKITWQDPFDNWKESTKIFFNFKNAIKYYNSI